MCMSLKEKRVEEKAKRVITIYLVNIEKHTHSLSMRNKAATSSIMNAGSLVWTEDGSERCQQNFIISWCWLLLVQAQKHHWIQLQVEHTTIPLSAVGFPKSCTLRPEFKTLWFDKKHELLLCTHPPEQHQKATVQLQTNQALDWKQLQIRLNATF